MYDRARRTAAGIMADICSAGSLEAAERLRAELYGESGNVFAGDSDVRRHIKAAPMSWREILPVSSVHCRMKPFLQTGI